MNVRPTGEAQAQKPGYRPGQGLSDLAYDLLTILKNKAQAVRAYDIYVTDAQKENAKDCVELLKRFQREDLKDIEDLRQQAAAVLGRLSAASSASSSSLSSSSPLSSSSSSSASSSSSSTSPSPGTSAGPTESRLEARQSDMQTCSGRSSDIGRTANSSTL